jgi:hypothetical protein
LRDGEWITTQAWCIQLDRSRENVRRVEGLPVVLSKRHAKIRREGCRCRAP